MSTSVRIFAIKQLASDKAGKFCHENHETSAETNKTYQNISLSTTHQTHQSPKAGSSQEFWLMLLEHSEPPSASLRVTGLWVDESCDRSSARNTSRTGKACQHTYSYAHDQLLICECPYSIWWKTAKAMNRKVDHRHLMRTSKYSSLQFKNPLLLEPTSERTEKPLVVPMTRCTQP